jgi:hypothetical protein
LLSIQSDWGNKKKAAEDQPTHVGHAFHDGIDAISGAVFRWKDGIYKQRRSSAAPLDDRQSGRCSTADD